MAIRTVAVGVSLGLLSLGLQLPSASADTAPTPAGTPATVSADALPTWQINGVVWSQVLVGNTVYVAGQFTQAGPPGTAVNGAGWVEARNAFAYDITTGNRVASFHPVLNGTARAVTKSPDGKTVYFGGDFTKVDNASRNHIAAFSTATNSLVTSFPIPPGTNSQVAALAATSSTLYVGGTFTSAGGGNVVNNLAAFSTATGKINKGWNPKAVGNGVFKGGVTTMVVTPDGKGVVIGGHFTSLAGAAAYGMGAVDATNGSARPWAANARIRDAGSDGAITSLATDGTNIYGSGYSEQTGDPNNNNFEGTFAANPANGAIVWVNDCHGDTYSVLPVGKVLYTAGHAHDCSAIGNFPDTTNPRVNHRALAFTTYATGTNTGPDSYNWNYNGLPDSTLLHWFPTLVGGTFTNQDQAAWSVVANSNYVAYGGEFPSVNGRAQYGLVRFAVSAIAPNKMGPQSLPGLTASSPSAATAALAWTTPWDMDNRNLTYSVYRSIGSGSNPIGTAPIYRVASASSFWQSPTLTFTDHGLPTGTYRYAVQAVDPFGNLSPVSTVRTVQVTGSGNQLPVAAISAPSCVLLACSFSGSGSNDPGGSISSYRWYFGDGATSTSANSTATHTYATAQPYTVVLQVTDNSGAVTATQRVVTPISKTTTRLIVTPAGKTPAGGAVRLTAVVSPKAPGTVIFRDGSKPLAGPVRVVNGSATLVTTKLGVGTHRSLQALYTPTAGAPFIHSNSAVAGHTVVKASSTVAIKLSPSKIKRTKKAKVAVVVILRGSHLRATGTVKVRDGKKIIKTGKLTAGKVTLTLPRLKAGKHKISVVYYGSPVSLKKTSAKKTLTVTR